MSQLLSSSHPINRSCPVCGSEPSDPYLAKADLQLVRCRSCSMIYATPVPAEFISGKHYDALGNAYYLSPAKLQSDYSPVRFERELCLFHKYCPSGRVLDVGCSSGAFLYQLENRFPGVYETLGTDTSGPALDYAEKQGITVQRGDYLKEDFGTQIFDAVTFWAVLEHVAVPAAFLDKTASLLREGGICLALVPNMHSLAVRILKKKYRYIYPQHLNYFTAETLTRLAERRFSVIDFHSTHFNPVVIWQDWRGRGGEISNEERATLLQRTTSLKQNRLLAPVRVIYGVIDRLLGVMNLADNITVVLRRK